MGGHDHFGFVAKQMQRLVDIAAPRSWVAHRRAAQGVHIVQTADGIFCSPVSFKLWQPSVHFRRCFGSWGALHHHGDAIDRDLFDIFADLFGWCD